MNIPELPWPSTYENAIQLQKELAGRLVLTGKASDTELIAGVDCSCRGSTGTMIGAVVVWSRTQNQVIASSTSRVETDFPYIPGLLAFREIPALLEAFRGLDTAPDVIIVDGQGTAHMRGFGIACHLGLYLGIPTVGCGKSRLVGSFEVPGNEKGSVSPLTYKGSEVGRVVRTRTGVSPVFVSPGHLIGMDSAVDLILQCCIKYRLPEPIRAAHNLAGEVRKSNKP